MSPFAPSVIAGPVNVVHVALPVVSAEMLLPPVAVVTDAVALAFRLEPSRSEAQSTGSKARGAKRRAQSAGRKARGARRMAQRAGRKARSVVVDCVF
jgi:hypothetical protein